VSSTSAATSAARLDDEGALACGRTAEELGLDGLIVSNTTISREGLTPPLVDDGPGGISGRPVFARSTELLRTLKRAHGDKLVMIGVGGIFDAYDAQAKLDAGADLLQVYTGFIYGGPGFVRRLLTGLLETSSDG
jgi:dihydroorotate dehydrogenase